MASVDLSNSSGLRLIRPLRDFLRTEAASSAVLGLAAVIALAWANGPWKAAYSSLWNTAIQIDVGRWSLHLTARQFVNDGLMTVFFLVAGLEIKRELVDGELRNPRAAALPILAAVGGMIVPAVLFVAITELTGGGGGRGWGIPMATDIALSVGVLGLLGSRVSASAKLFLLAVAIVDDIGVIIVIALFYGHGVNWEPLFFVVALVLVIVALRAAGVHARAPFIVAGGLLWLAMHASGLHATLAGIVLGLLAPIRPAHQIEQVDVDKLNDLSTVGAARETMQIARRTVSEVEWLEHVLHPWTSFAVVPLFALANTGILVSGQALGDAFHSRVALGVAVGLVIGKVAGITAAVWLALRAGVAVLPDDLTMRDVVGIASVAGVGFTVAIFVTDLAYAGRPDLQQAAKVAVLAGSILSALLGATLLSHNRPASPVTRRRGYNRRGYNL